MSQCLPPVGYGLPPIELLDKLDRALESRAMCTHYTTFLNCNQEFINIINEIGNETLLNLSMEPRAIWVALRQLAYNAYHLGNDYLRYLAALNYPEAEPEEVQTEVQVEQLRELRKLLLIHQKYEQQLQSHSVTARTALRSYPVHRTRLSAVVTERLEVAAKRAVEFRPFQYPTITAFKPVEDVKSLPLGDVKDVTEIISGIDAIMLIAFWNKYPS